MKRILLPIAIGVVLLCIAFLFSRSPNLTGNSDANANPFGVSVAEKNPWTNLSPNIDHDQFQFVIVSDRTGGHREKIFSKAVSQINLMQPEFVVSVGDLIEGYSTDDDKLKQQWEEFDRYVKKLEMPFFYVSGNHDVGNKQELAMWEARYGRNFYSFVYKNALFLCLNTEDGKGGNKVGEEQIAFVKKELATRLNIRWTFVIVHKPIWTATDLEKSGWLDVEKELAGRQYTVFCGHVHRYQKYVRNGMNYYQLATTGGGSKLRGVEYGEFDQIAWITMKKDGPRIANILLNGVLPENLLVPESDEAGVVVKKLPLAALKGKITFNGKPLANAVVSLQLLTVPNGYKNAGCDGVTDENGLVELSTYTKSDGAPIGEHRILITQNIRNPGGNEPAKNLVPIPIPLKYAKQATTPLRLTVKETGNELNINLEE